MMRKQNNYNSNGSYTSQWIELYKSEFKIQDGTQVNNPLKKSYKLKVISAACGGVSASFSYLLV